MTEGLPPVLAGEWRSRWACSPPHTRRSVKCHPSRGGFGGGVSGLMELVITLFSVSIAKVKEGGAAVFGLDWVKIIRKML